jgi:hypothetical protein
MPCLDKAFASLKDLLPSLQREKVLKVQSGVMPCSMRLLLGVVHVHTGNGAMVACVTQEDGEEVLYTRCFCPCNDKNILKTTLVPILRSTEESAFPWVMLDKARYCRLMGRLSLAGGASKGGAGKRQRREATP